jgi:hypothetical protein
MAKDRSFEISALAVAALFAVVLLVGNSPTGEQAGNQYVFCSLTSQGATASILVSSESLQTFLSVVETADGISVVCASATPPGPTPPAPTSPPTGTPRP